MKRRAIIVSIMVLALAMLVMASCAKHELGGEIGDDMKSMAITATNAEKDASFSSGVLEVTDDEQISITPNLEKGALKIEFILSEGGESMEELPEDAEAVYTANVSGDSSQAVGFGGGSYMVKVTVTEEATGTVDIAVK